MKRNQGFTITELMIAVVIIGVLSMMAIPTFTSYIYKGRALRRRGRAICFGRNAFFEYLHGQWAHQRGHLLLCGRGREHAG